MTSTGPFRSVAQTPRGGPTPAEEHLGDRLAAFVDGELRDDQRERVQAHLVTCPQCKAEADEQRRLKSAVAGAIPPAVSAGLLARLQGLPGGDLGGPGGGGADACSGDLLGPRSALAGGLADGRRTKSYLTPSRDGELSQASEPAEGFPIHDVSRGASRGRRFAFAAAGAFSLAAFALGGALPLDALVEGGAASDPGPGAAASQIGVGAPATGRPGEVQPGVLTAPLSVPTPLSAARPLLSRQSVPAPVGGLSPAPADAISSAVPTALTTPVAVPQSSPAAFTAEPVSPSPLPLLGVAVAQQPPGR